MGIGNRTSTIYGDLTRPALITPHGDWKLGRAAQRMGLHP